MPVGLNWRFKGEYFVIFFAVGRRYDSNNCLGPPSTANAIFELQTNLLFETICRSVVWFSGFNGVSHLLSGIVTFLLLAQKKSNQKKKAVLPAVPTTCGDCAVFDGALWYFVGHWVSSSLSKKALRLTADHPLRSGIPRGRQKAL